MNRIPAPSLGARTTRRTALDRPPRQSRWHRWLYRALAPLLLASLVLPLAPRDTNAANVDWTRDGDTGAVHQQTPPTEKPFEELAPEDLFGQPIYEVVKAQWDKTFKPAKGIEIKIPAVDYVASGGLEGLQRAENFQGRPGATLLWTIDDGWVEWEVDIPQTGLYEITVDYYPILGKRASVQRDLYIDGELPFREAKRIVFQRVWREQSWPPKRDNRGNDVRPPQVETPQWERKTLEDADGRYSDAFQFAFTAGKHKFRLATVREPIALGTITVHSPKLLPAYKEKLAEWKAMGAKEVTGNKLVLHEAEVIYQKSDPTIRGEVNFDALGSPTAEGLFRLNSFGWWRWRLPGQWVRWKVTVPEDGLYQITLKVWQGWGGRRPRLRQLLIDDEIPFSEMRSILYRSGREWRNETMRVDQKPEGAPYFFYLTKGEHTVQMEMTLGFMSETVRAIDQSLTEMSLMGREMLMVTGAHPDPNMEWDLHEKIPNLIQRLQAIVDRMELQAKRMEEIGSSRNDASSAFYVVTDQIKTMIRKPHDMHRMIDDYNRSQGILAAWLLHLQNHPLAVDYVMVHSADAKLPPAEANIFQKTVASVQTFVMSFFRDYTGLGSIYGKDDRVVEVWLGRGTEWGLIMKDMIEDDFTPSTGIKVNLRVIPPANLGEGAGSVLLLAATAGEAPDVAVGVPSQLPVDFAVRGGLINLNDFPDYPQVAQRFRPGALIPFRYTLPGASKQGDWALPETQNFAMSFYRLDILHELGIKPPETWEDVYDALLKLQQNGLDFSYPPPTGVTVAEGSVGFTPFLFQNGGDYYNCADVCRSALDTPQALIGFQEWTDLYSNYKIPREANFFTRIRTGEQPMGVADYKMYISLSVAAPELTGRWEMRPMPGHRRPDGTIDRTSGGTGESMVIFQQSQNKEAAWEFIRWWSGKDAQQRFGAELEALIGVEARWNTANLEALRALPWPRKDIANIMEQWSWFKEPPVVLGGYFTGRHVLNAWNRVVLQGMNPREALEEAIYDINKELAKKQEEFGLTVDKSMYRRG
ncbi:MAG: extracellular solute-binding protein [Chloroflexi bacterium]|nr:extracellular solute-binding protein [Chloroflexota bacterium]